MNRPKVFVVQERLRNVGGHFVPQFDLSPAAVYGELEFLLPSGAVALAPGPMIATLRHKLRNFSDDDVLLAVGDPVAIGAATLVAGSMNRGRVNMLKWDKHAGAYIKVTVDLKGEA